MWDAPAVEDSDHHEVHVEALHRHPAGRGNQGIVEKSHDDATCYHGNMIE